MIDLKKYKILTLVVLILSHTAFSAFAEGETQNTGTLAWDLEFADGLFIRGMYNSAIKEYKKVLRKFSDEVNSKEVEFKIAEAYFKKNDFEDAEGAFQKYIEDHPEDPIKEVAKFYLGMIAYMSSEFSIAVDRFGEVEILSLSPKYKAMLHYYKGICFKEMENYESAIDSFGNVQDTDVIQLRPIALEARAFCFKKMGKLDEANLVLETLVEKYPEDTGLGEIYIQLGKNYFEVGDFERSLESFTLAKERASGPTKVLITQYGLIKNYFQTGKTDEVISLAEEALQSEMEPQIRVEIEYLLASALFQTKSYESAAEKLEKLVREDTGTPFSEQIYLQALWTFYELDDKTRMEKSLQSFQEKFPESLALAEGHFLKGEILYEHEEFPEALGHYRESLAINPVFRYAEYAHFKMAMCLKFTEGKQEALEAFSKFQETFPESTYLENTILESIILGEELKNYEQVLKSCNRYVEKFVDGDALEMVFMKKVQMEFELKNFTVMEESLKRFLEVFPESVHKREAYYYLGWYFEKNENYSEATGHFQLALDVPNKTQVIGDEEIWLQLGLSHYFAMQYEEAQKYFLLVFDSPERKSLPTDMLLWLGDHLGEKEELDRAVAVYRVLLVDAKGEAGERVLFKLASWHFEMGDWEPALKFYEKIVKGSPESELFLFSKVGMADCYFKMESFPKSKALYEGLQLSEVPYVKARAHAGLGEIYYQEGNLDEAVRSFMFVTILFDDPLVPELMYKSVKINLELKNTEEARKILDELRDRFPESEWISKTESLIPA